MITHDRRLADPGRSLGARGHLVILREGDVTYRHRVFLEFVDRGAVRAASFTLDIA